MLYTLHLVHFGGKEKVAGRRSDGRATGVCQWGKEYGRKVGRVDNMSIEKIEERVTDRRLRRLRIDELLV